jgi:predicted nucleic acid-binding protein
MPSVLDSFPLLVLFQAQPGWEIVRDRLKDAETASETLYLSAHNYGEIYYTILRRFGETALTNALAAIDKMPIEIVLPDFSDFTTAARLKGTYGSSYPDCFAAALALDRNMPVLTGDPEFKKLEAVGVKVEWMPSNR